MEKRRLELLKKLEVTLTQDLEPEDFLSVCYQILYGLPWELQIQAASAALERYLPIFAAKCPDQAWPQQLLNDVDAWHRAGGQGA